MKTTFKNGDVIASKDEKGFNNGGIFRKYDGNNIVVETTSDGLQTISTDRIYRVNGRPVN